MRRVRKTKQRLSGYRYRRPLVSLDVPEMPDFDDWTGGPGLDVKTEASQA